MSADAIAAVLEALEAQDQLEEGVVLPKRFCFLEGTHVATLRGEMPVQQLRVGDHIRARKGSFHTISDLAVHAFDDLDPAAQAKIGLSRILRGAVEEGLPRRDLYVSDGQEFELSRRLEISHAVRMSVRKCGEALSGLRFVVFACDGLPMIRAEGLWTTLTPVERFFPVVAPAPQAESGADAAELPDTAAETSVDEPAAPAPRPVTRLMEAAARTPGAIPRPRTRFLARPASGPASHHTETGTPGR
jgi:hypothetical protein